MLIASLVLAIVLLAGRAVYQQTFLGRGPTCAQCGGHLHLVDQEVETIGYLYYVVSHSYRCDGCNRIVWSVVDARCWNDHP